MKRYDLRHLKDNFYDRMAVLIDKELKVNEVGIFLFEVGDFSHIQKSADFVRATGNDLMNSLKFNEVDWTIVVKKVDDVTRKERAEKIETARVEAEKQAEEKAEAERIAAEKKVEEEAKTVKEEAVKHAKEEKVKEEADAKDKKETETKSKSLKSTAKKASAVKKETVKKETTKKSATQKVKKPKAK